MADRPILMSPSMVRATLREIEQPGTGKTQTRRIMNRARVFATPETPAFTLTGDDMARALQNASRFRRLDGDGWFWEADAFEWQAPAERTGWMAHIGYAPGDRLWVRESLERANGEAVGYPADLTWLPNTPWEWQRDRLPSIHMPRRLSRITLIVTDVRVQRLQEISDVDALAEGILTLNRVGYLNGGPLYGLDEGIGHGTPVGAFNHLWRSINGDGSWAANPWVVAITFRPILANIDAIEEVA